MLATLPLADFPLAAESLPPTTTVVLVGTSKNLTVGIGTLTIALAVPLSGRGTNFAKGTGTLTTVVIPVGPILGFIGEYGEDSPE